LNSRSGGFALIEDSTDAFLPLPAITIAEMNV